MEPLVQKVVTVLEQEFPGAHVDVSARNGAGRLFGIISWDRFADLDQVDRQSRLWSLLRERLSDDERQQISAILTMTPAEMSDDEPD